MNPADSNLVETLRQLDAESARETLESMSDEAIAGALEALGPSRAVDVFETFDDQRQQRIAAATTGGTGAQWLVDHSFPDGTVGRLIEPTVAVFSPDATVSEVVEALRDAVKHTLITYLFVTAADHTLVGVVAFRELVFARATQRLEDIMVRNPFWLTPRMSLVDAMREVVTRHYPVYPVCDEQGHLIGLVRGQSLFEEQAFEISAQAGSMVGVEKEERLATPWTRSLRFRHPWLQLNLITAFVAAAVVGIFQDTIDQIVLLAVFLPVLSGQCSNTGCQALAVTLRGMTLGELKPGRTAALIAKEALLGAVNGGLTGLVAGLGMYVMARVQSNPDALVLAIITFAAMALSCFASGVAGAAVPLALKRMGADPATASSIFLTTATDVVSMGAFLGLAAWMIV